MIEKLKWTDAFLRKGGMHTQEGCRITGRKITRPATEPEIVKNIVLALTECPGCGYVFENAFHKKSNDVVIFTHGWRKRTEKCQMKMSDIRTIYHIKRATRIAQGVITS
jgi:uncharacterized Zn finger protein